MEFLSTKTAVPTLDRKRIQSYVIPFTEDHMEQIRIATYLDDKTSEIDQIIAEKKQLVADLELYMKSLIYETITGKRKVV
jgi:type I restriction enzyme S subunit